MEVESDERAIGWIATYFKLPAVDGSIYKLNQLTGKSGTLIMFICNHCPYVLSVVDRIVDEAAKLKELGIGVVAICSNDARDYPEDSFSNMRLFANRHGLNFPYLHDEDQEVAESYMAVCTPDFFGFNANLELQYRGRLDSSGRSATTPSTRRELYLAMQKIAETGVGPSEQIPSIGCSIKWSR